MNNDIYFGKNSLRFLYYRYKDSSYYSLSLIVVTIVICTVLFFQVVLPQLENWFSIRREVVATRVRIDTIRNNINYMNNLNKSELDQQLQIAASSLPPEKDFGAILNALSVSAVQSGISFNDYSFEVGNIASTSAKYSNSNIKGLSSVKVTVAVNGTVDGIEKFIREVQSKLPLSEVTDINGDISSLTIKIQFFQKAFSKVNQKDDEPYPRISTEDNTQLNKLSGWQPDTHIQDIVNTTPGSSSGVSLF